MPPPDLTRYFGRPSGRRLLGLVFYILLSLVCAIIISLAFGQSYDASKQKPKGEPRTRYTRDTPEPAPESATKGFKDPYANRPRIRTKNGHLVIEASQDKNVEFKTSGSRGTVSINGHKLDQLLDVAKALERSTNFTGNITGSGGKLLLGAAQKPGDQYELILRNLMGSGERVAALEMSIASLRDLVGDLSKQMEKLTKKLNKRANRVDSNSRQLDTVLTKLKKNDCLNPDTGLPVCKNGATCLDQYDGFKCLCTANFEGPTCEQDVDECARFRGTDLGCQNGATCVNLPGGYKCECPQGFHGVHCTERHEDCSLSSSRALCGFGTCVQLARTGPNQPHYECLCDQGWTTDGIRPECVIDVNECQASANASQVSLFKYPCSQDPYVDCTNLPGSFKCGPCPAGYTGDGRRCSDIDECSVDNGGCSTSPLVDCINTVGSRICGLCPAGYTGDGLQCTPVGACSTQSNGGCHPMARCVDLASTQPPAKICICQWPFQGTGIGSEGCRLPTGISSPTNFTIQDQSAQQSTNDCNPNPCLHQGQCFITEASFECICPSGWAGKTCGDSTAQAAGDKTDACGGGQFYLSRGKVQFPLSTSKRPASSTSSSTANEERHFNCKWTIAVARNMSVKLTFNNVINKINPGKKVQFFLANQTSATNHHAQVSPPTCAESLDVWERVIIETGERRLLARFCTAGRTLLQETEVGSGRELVIIAESNQVELEYSFTATRTQFGDPSLAFQMNWLQIAPPCGGELPVAESGSLSSPNFPEFYSAGIECRYVLRVDPQRRLRIQFGELNLLTSGRRASTRPAATDGSSPSQASIPTGDDCADSLTILDGQIGSDRPILFRYCANEASLMSISDNTKQIPSSIKSSSSSVEIILESQVSSTTPLMKPHQKRGFFLTYAAEPASPGCGGLWTRKSGTVKSADYEPAQVDETQLELAKQMTKLFDPAGEPVIQGEPKQEAFPGRQQKYWIPSTWYKTRCEYAIRPADQRRNHKVLIDWLEMPASDSVTQPKVSYTALNSWTRQVRCLRSRLAIYETKPQDNSQRNELAVFCAGDHYNASLTTLTPVVSSGHLLYLVYETTRALPDESPTQAGGFKLRYSTICSAVYEQAKGRIQVEIDSEVRECIYHILLPPNNTISLLVEPPKSSLIPPVAGAQIDDRPYLSTSATSDVQSCLAQAVFMDGAILGGRQALASAERELKSYNFARARQQQGNATARQSGDTIDLTASESNFFEPTAATTIDKGGSSSRYWQYSNFKTHDIKEFEVCRLPSLSFDSIWNHLSLLFRYDPPSSAPNLRPVTPVRLNVQYTSAPTCGGIISEPSSGSIQLTTRAEGPCSWVMRAAPQHAIMLDFFVPLDEIKKRISDWHSNTTQKDTLDCGRLFKESIELYEPSMNRSRVLCPSEFIGINATRWTGQSNILLIRLQENQIKSVNSTAKKVTTPRPQAVPKSLGQIEVKYKFVSTAWSRQGCGGRLLHDSGVITTPRYPFFYPSGASCTWIIQAQPGQQVRLNITKFELEKQDRCTFDYLELRNGPTSESPLIGRFCRQDLDSKVIVGHSNTMWLHFASDAYLTASGFEIYYDGAQTGCGGRLMTVSGQIDSPNYPYPTGHAVECEWSIELAQSNQIELTFEDLDLSSGPGYGSSADCPKAQENSSLVQTNGNYLAIYDSGTDTRRGPILLRVCHMEQLAALNKTTFVTPTNRLTIVLRTQALDNSRGFRITYKTHCRPIELIGFGGVLESPGFPSGYAPNMLCGWSIRGPLGAYLTLVLTDLDIEQSGSFDLSSCSDDFMDIWELKNGTEPETTKVETQQNKLLIPSLAKNGNLLRRLCGNLDQLKNSRRSFQTSTNLAYISFVSDKAIDMRGFRLEWQAQAICGGRIEGSKQRIDFRENTLPPTFGKPYECFWTLDLTHSGGDGSIKVSSDMQKLGSTISDTQQQQDKCADGSLTIYDGPNDKAPVLMNNCDTKSIKFISLTNGQALIKFYSDGKQNFGRVIEIDLIGDSRMVPFDNPNSCLQNDYKIDSRFNEVAGERKSPNYPDLYDSSNYNCFGSLSSPMGRLKINILELDIPAAPNGDASQVSTDSKQAGGGLLSREKCMQSGNYLAFMTNRGPYQSRMYCGKMTDDQAIYQPTGGKVGELITEHENLDIRFKTSSAGFRGRWRFTYTRLCGAPETIEWQTTFRSPDYPDRPKWVTSSDEKSSPDGKEMSENVCLWRLRLPLYSIFNKQRVEKKLHITITQFDASDGLPNARKDDCLRIFEGAEISLKQARFNLTDFDLKAKVRLCRQEDLKHSTMSYVSQGQEVYVMTSGQLVFQFKVAPFENYCGGQFQMERAEFASLNYPQPYDPDLDCNYIIRGAPGAKIKLHFADFDLPEPQMIDDDDDSKTLRKVTCDNVDYFEIRQISFSKIYKVGLAKMLNAYTKIDSEGSDRSEAGNSTLMMQQATTNVSSQIVRRVKRLVEMTRFYNLLFSDTMVHHMTTRINPIADDFYENSRLVGRYCGRQLMSDLTTAGAGLQDLVFIRFRSHQPDNKFMGKLAPVTRGKRQPKGFLADYKLEYGGLVQIVPIDNSTSELAFIASPRFPAMTRSNSTITWTFETQLDWILQFDLIGMNLGATSKECQDSVKIYDGFNPKDGKQLSKLCGHLSYKDLRKSSQTFSYLHDLILLGAEQWNITSVLQRLAPFNQAHDPIVRANLIRSTRTSSNVASIVYDNLRSEGSFLLVYRAINPATRALNETIEANETMLALASEDDDFDQDGGETNGSQSAANVTCSRTISLSFSDGTNSSQKMIMSPNWPQAPPPNIECHWLLNTVEDTTINLALDPQPLVSGNSQTQQQEYSLEAESSCFSQSDLSSSNKRDFIVVHDGATRMAPVMGKYCLPIGPKQFSSTGRHMLVRYVHATSSSSALLRGRASIGECGGHYHVLGYTSTNLISDRPAKRGKYYLNNQQCKYYLFAANTDQVLYLHTYALLSKFDLATEPTNADCSVGDYLEIRDLPIQSERWDFSQSQTGRLLGRYCAGHKLTTLESPGPALSITFHTDGAQVATGWRIAVGSSAPRSTCPMAHRSINLDQPYGQLTSPNWPHGFFGKRQCIFHLAAPIGSAIELTFVRLQRQYDPQQPDRCLDSIDYLADNEGASLRYSTSTLRELKSSVSGTQLRQAVKTIECRANESSQVKPLPYGLRGEPLMDKSENDGAQSYLESINASSYWSMLNSALPNPITIKTNSRILLIDYQAKNTIAGQGFLAVYRLVDNSTARCSRQVAYKESEVGKSNIFESSNFGLEMFGDRDDFVQCEWNLDTTNSDFFSNHLSMRYRASAASSIVVGDYRSMFLVFQVIEVPPLQENKTVMMSGGYRIERQGANVCGLSRMMILDAYYQPKWLLCGNLTDKYRWTLLDYDMRRISLRTKNLRQGQKVYRGVRGYLYQRMCPRAERMLGEGIRIKSHSRFNSSTSSNSTSYPAGICRWTLNLDHGEHELWFESLKFRPIAGVSSGPSCDDLSQDHLEVRASASSSDAPLLARYCFQNQQVAAGSSLSKPLKLGTLISELSLVFVAGLKQLSSGTDKFLEEDSATPNSGGGGGNKQQFGFEMKLVRSSNSSANQFCRKDKAFSVYNFIRSADDKWLQHDRTMYAADFFEKGKLYPSMTHCQIPLSLDEEQGSRFNFTFKGIFDMEAPSSGKECTKDYIQIEDLVPKQGKEASALIPNLVHLSAEESDKLFAKRRVGRWCGRDKPKGYFTSQSGQVLITFHSNERIEGKGFLLEVSPIRVNNTNI